MNDKSIIIMAGVLLGISAGITFFWYQGKRTPQVPETIQPPRAADFALYEKGTFRFKEKEFFIFIADTQKKRSLGLSYTEQLPEDTGVAFVYSDAGTYSFWMNEMLFPLDIIWVHDSVVVDIWENAPIPENGVIPTSPPPAEATIIYEFEAGFVSRYNVAVGDRLEFMRGESK